MPSPRACRIAHHMSKDIFHTVSGAEQGCRLDALVARIAQYGFRTAKRAIAEGNVLVNGKSRPPHYKVVAESCLVIRQTVPEHAFPLLEVAAASSDYMAFVKPAGLHTAHIAESNTPSLEQSIACQWLDYRATGNISPGSALPDFLLSLLPEQTTPSLYPLSALPENAPLLLSRLDAATSGLVPAATSAAAAERFKVLERTGLVCKYYLTVVRGSLEKNLTITNALDTDTRKKTRVLEKFSADKTRHTEVFPLNTLTIPSFQDTGENLSFAAVRIKRGARHQIRAHLAYAGFPLLGDALYGPDPETQNLHLHHACLTMPDFFAFCLPAWFTTE